MKEIYAYCARRLFCRHLAEDAASAVFLRLVEEFPSLKERSRSGIRSWLYGTASNVVASVIRDARCANSILPEVARQKQSVADNQAQAGSPLDWPTLYKGIYRLKPRYQEVLVLRYFQGLETGAIAEALGLSRVAVRVRLHRAVSKLRRELEASFGEQSPAS